MRRFHVSGPVALFSAFLMGATLFAQTANPPPSTNGVIASINGSSITLTLADGTQKVVALQSTTLILDRQVSAVDQIKTGDAMGVAARRDNGALIATSINIFSPQMWDGVKKGQWLMDNGQTMTNAMTTAYAQGMNGHTLTMKAPDGTVATITVPDNAIVHRLVTVQKSDLTVGLNISVRGDTDKSGAVMATSISFDQPTKS